MSLHRQAGIGNQFLLYSQFRLIRAQTADLERIVLSTGQGSVKKRRGSYLRV